MNIIKPSALFVAIAFVLFKSSAQYANAKTKNSTLMKIETSARFVTNRNVLSLMRPFFNSMQKKKRKNARFIV